MKTAFGFIIGVALAGITLSSAQKAERGTQHWTVTIPSGPISDYGTMHVFDMSGTCVYVYEGNSKGGIAVVSKTQLPQGAGCQ